jgi:ABC-type phosphate/phosphonate transport system substrate-binding protein
MVCASLAMYDLAPPVQAANDLLWQGIRDRILAAGFAAPEHLDRQVSYHDIWLKPDLVLAQTCGYPYVSMLRGKVQLVATPVFTFAGGKGTERVSYVIVGETSACRNLEDLRGRVVALNGWDSNSGMNLLRATIAPLARDGRFFSDVTITGGHVASIAAVRAGIADVAAIDTVTWGLLAKHQPDMLAGVRILAETPSGPGLPYITRLTASDAEVQALRKALADAIADPSSAGAIDTLGIAGIEILTDVDYERLDALRRDAEQLRYPIIA